MLVSLNWLKQYIDYGSLSADELGELITKSGIEVDGINYIISEQSDNIVVGYVKECEQHPNADKLKLCQVDVGTELLQIICGAANVAQGQKVVVAKPGAVLPGNFKIKKVKLRGIESNGMICSLEELGVKEEYILPEFAEGIIVLPEDTEVGEDVTELLNLNDAILEFDLTPNRADALSMLGVAYDVSAILDKSIQLPEPTISPIDEPVANYVTVDVLDSDLCPYYGAFVIKDIEVKPAPLWMQNYLVAAGIRPINNVVDITNYVLLEYGQPLHAFDYDLLESKEIVVRRAEKDEEIVTLDDQTRVLSEQNLLITNGKKGVALAGVMGGANTEVSDDTTTVLLEAALFDAQTVRQVVNETGLRSEASNRFEKGVDPKRVKEAGLRACQLFEQYANGKVVHGVAEFDEADYSEKTIKMNRVQVNERLGTDLTAEQIDDILQRLQFTFTREDDDYSVTAPTRRGDLSIFEDMLEEVARIYGYDNLPYTLPENASQPGGLTVRQKLHRQIKAYLQSAGLFETMTYSLTDAESVQQFISPEIAAQSFHPVRLHSPMSEAHEYLRQSLLPQILQAVTYNLARKESQVRFFEIGSVFLSEEKQIQNQPREYERLSGVLTGNWVDHKWQQQKTSVDFYVVKGIIEGLFAYLDLDVTFQAERLEGMHPGRCALITYKGDTIGFIGQVHPYYAKQKDLKETYVFDVNLEFVLDKVDKEILYNAVPRYPAVKRDIAFVVDHHVTSADIQNLITQNDSNIIKNVEAFDVYSGDNLAENKKSLAYHIDFQDKDKTLTDEEVDALMDDIISSVTKKFSAFVRTE